MKKLILLVSCLVLFIACDGQKQLATEKTSVDQSGIISVIYEANSRGFYQKIVAQNQQVTIFSDRNKVGIPEVITISDSEWRQIIVLSEEVNFDTMETLKAPTEKRFYDGAAIANLSINKKDIIHVSSDFDNGFPPKELEKIVQKLTSYAVKK
jgi:hypothetical protein